MSAPFENNYDDMVPEGGIPLMGVRVLLYLDGSENASPKYRFSWAGEGSSVELVGLLELIKGEVIIQSVKKGGLGSEEG